MKSDWALNLQKWLEAERSIGINSGPQPEGTVTSKQYAEKRKVSVRTARDILVRLTQTKPPKATREKWGSHFVYRLQ